MEQQETNETLLQGFRVHRLQGKALSPIPSHCHAFHKIVFLWQGEGTGVIEGKRYALHPPNVVLLPAGEIHYPVLPEQSPYDCTVLCVAPEFLVTYRRGAEDLAECFHRARETSGVMQIMDGRSRALLDRLDRLEKSSFLVGFADSLYREILFLECMILLNHAIRIHAIVPTREVTFDPKILSLMEYINGHLGEELVLDRLAKKFFFSKYYLMRKFKAATGYSMYRYIMSKRLFLARQMLREGSPAVRVCHDCGFRDYSAFSRAFKAMFGQQPTNYRGKARLARGGAGDGADA